MKQKNNNPENSSLSKHEIRPCFELTPTMKAKDGGKRVSFYAFKRASLTVEAAIALPLFIMVTICIISIMGIYSKTLDTMIRLRNTTEGSAAIASVTETEIWIELPGRAELSPIFVPEGIGSININCVGRARAWTGRSEQDDGTKDGKESEYVYVTENGSVYHTSSTCSHIDLSIHQTSSSNIDSMRNSNGGKYHSCEKCARGGAKGTVYITDDGDKYHNSLECSGLTRTVKLVNKEELGEIPLCSRCGVSH